MTEKRYKSYRIINGKPRNIIVDKNGNIVNIDPNKEEIIGLEKEHYKRKGNKAKKYADNELLEYLRQFYEENGRVPEQLDFNNLIYPTYKTYQFRFGSWNSAIEIAGLWNKRAKKIKYTNNELLEYLKQFYEDNGRIPTMENDFTNNPEYPGHSIYCERFGNWSNVLKLVGLDVESIVRKGIVETNQQKARLFELYIREHFIEESIDLSGKNCTSCIDGICPKGQTYDAKSTALFRDLYWSFYLNKIVDYYYLGGFDKDFRKLLYVWIIPGDFTEKTRLYIGIRPNYRYNIENMKEHEITEKFKDIELFQEIR